MKFLRNLDQLVIHHGLSHRERTCSKCLTQVFVSEPCCWHSQACMFRPITLRWDECTVCQCGPGRLRETCDGTITVKCQLSILLNKDGQKTSPSPTHSNLGQGIFCFNDISVVLLLESDI